MKNVMEKYTLENAKSLLGKQLQFKLPDAEEVWEAKVITVKESPIHGDEWEAFSMVIETEQVQFHPNDHYLFELLHESIGKPRLSCSPKSLSSAEFVYSRRRE